MGITERKEREKEQRKNAIIDAAEKVFFSKGLDAATMDEVAEAAELSKGTLYLYFQNKYDLYLAINSRGLDIMNAMFEKAFQSEEKGLDKITAIGRAYYEYYKQYPDYFNSMIHWDAHSIDMTLETENARECGQKGNKALEIVARAVQAGVDDRTIRSDIDPLKTAPVLWGLATGILHMLATKADHLIEEHSDIVGFKNQDEMVEYAYRLIRFSLTNHIT
ncbi:MAG: TetR/AcrR family transcriptional regulator [Candidatus Aminicenantes bacterium]|nr:TetR/AcrR family transcriptional regulator [Candidatus Aminicenantes bacterium]